MLHIFSHRVMDPAPQYGMTPAMLHQLLDYLVDRQNAGQLTVRTMRDAYNAWNGTSPIVVVSFDDGWLSDYDEVYPLFKEHGLVGTSYIYPQPMDEMWSEFMGWAMVEEMAGLREPRPAPGPSVTRAGVRESTYGISPFPSAEEWETDMKAMASYWSGSQPTGIWIVGILDVPENNACRLQFPEPAGGPYANITFESTDMHESYLDYFDTHGIDVWLQIEPAFANMNTLIDLVLDQYGHHSCVKGFGVDCEWYRYTLEDDWGVPVTDSNAQSWESRVKSHNSNYTLFLKHFNYTWLPPSYRGDIIFVSDSMGFTGEGYYGLSAMVAEFTDHWAPWFYPNTVWFQIGYEEDKVWWDDLANPPKNIGDAIDAETTQTTGIIWVDFTLRDVFPPGGDTTPPAAPTGLTATAVSSSQINLDWNNNTEEDLSHYHVYRSTTSGFTPGAGTFVADTSVSNYSNTGLSASTTYYYKVTAVDTSVNESSPSAQASATTEEGAPPMMHAGLRASSYGISPFPSAEEWESDMKEMASYWPGSQPTGIWLVGLMDPPDVLGSTCHLEFPEPAGGPYPNISFESTDLHESYLDYFDTHGIDVWLQVEPGDANMNTLIDIVLDQYGHHSCVKGFGVDVEWYTTTSASVTDSNAQTWESRVKSHNSSYTLFIKFWNIDRTPPTYRGDIIFADDSQEFSSLAEMVSEFANYWAPEFYPNPVWFQYGYAADRAWWQNLTNPPKDIGDAIDAAVPQECGLFWVDFTMREVFPPGGDTTPPAAPTGLTATAVSSSQINLDWSNNTEPDLASYNVYRSTTSGFTPGTGTFVAQTTSSSYSNTGLSASTTYYYKVTAVDTSNNESSPSAQASATTEEGAAPSMTHAGLRASTYGISPFPSAEEWTNDMNTMASYWSGSQPTGVWNVGVMWSPNDCHLEFPGTSTDPNILFSDTDFHEPYLDYFDTHGIDVWLQVEPADADVETLIDLVLNQYGHHSCVKGLGVDVEWYKYSATDDFGVPVTDAEAEAWETGVKSHSANYTLYLKHFYRDWMPPNYRGNIIFVNDYQIFGNLSDMVAEFADNWAPWFYPNTVWFQVGYEADRAWWQNLTNPPKDIGDAIDAAVPQECGLFWVDFTMREVFPPGGDTTPPAAPTGLTATAVSTSQINLSWNANTEDDLDHYNVYRSTTSGFTPGSGTFVAEVTGTGGSSGYPAWDPNTVYTGGDRVVHDGIIWEANWWTQGEEPGTTGEWGVWDEIGPASVSPEYSDTGLSADTTYYYKVTAVDTSVNESSPSAQASATTQGGAPPPPGGWDFECHTYTHPFLTSLSADGIRSELNQVNAAFAAHGLPTPQHNSYPYGEYNATVESVVAEYRLSGRAAWAVTGTINTYPMADWYAMNAVEIQASTAFSTIQGYIDQAITHNALINIFTHRVMDPAPQYGCTPAMLRQVCSYLLDRQNAGQLQVLPIRDAYTSWNGTKAVVVLAFDDGWKTDYTNTWGIVSGEYGFVGTSYIYPAAMDGMWADFLSWAEVQAMAAG